MLNIPLIFSTATLIRCRTLYEAICWFIELGRLCPWSPWTSSIEEKQWLIQILREKGRGYIGYTQNTNSSSRHIWDICPAHSDQLSLRAASSLRYHIHSHVYTPSLTPHLSHGWLDQRWTPHQAEPNSLSWEAGIVIQSTCKLRQFRYLYLWRRRRAKESRGEQPETLCAPTPRGWEDGCLGC